MSRRYVPKKKFYKKEDIYKSIIVTIIVNRIISRGKKYSAYKIIYSSLEKIKEKTKNPPNIILEHAIKMVSPKFQLKSRRVGGTNYQIPIEINKYRRINISIKWIIDSARKRQGRNIFLRIYTEVLDASRGKGNAIRKREETERISEANKAFVRYRFL